MKNIRKNMTKTLYFKLILSFCIFTFCKIRFAQATEISPIFGLGQEDFTFEVSEFDPNNKNRKLSFEPNIAGVVRLGVNAYGFGVGYSFRGSEKDIDPAKGKTDYSDLQLGYNSKNWGIESYYQSYEGFFTTSTSQIQTCPHLNLKRVGITARYALGDEEFSVGGITDQSSDITETSGKYYIIMGYDEHNLNTDVSLLQFENVGINMEFESLRVLKSNDFKTGFGAGKHWVFYDQYFVGGMVDILATYANYQYTSSTAGKSTEHDLTTSTNFRLALGYKGSSFRSGLSLTSDATTLKATGNAYIRPSSNKLLLYVRYVTEF
ncbi:MAG: DUF4421 family protein [Pseudobdellovibrio sp.]